MNTAFVLRFGQVTLEKLGSFTLRFFG